MQHFSLKEEKSRKKGKSDLRSWLKVVFLVLLQDCLVLTQIERLMLSKLRYRELRFCDCTFMIYNVCWIFYEIAFGEIVWDKKEIQVTTVVCIPFSNETLLLVVFWFFLQETIWKGNFGLGTLKWSAIITGMFHSTVQFTASLYVKTGYLYRTPGKK